MSPSAKVAVVVGNPKARSRTYAAAELVALKLFLDRIGGGAPAGVTAVPLMLGGDWRHSLAPEILLKPVLTELGATCPTRGLYLVDSEYTDSAALDAWVEQARPQVTVTSGQLR